MKKILIPSILLIPFLVLKYVHAATQAQNLGVISASVKSMTAAQILISTSTARGELVYCTDCTANGGVGTICVSTGTLRSSFILSTGTVCK
jgi:hypothetical protein